MATRYATKSLQRLITELHRLPNVGPRNAERLALFILDGSDEKARALAEAIIEVKEKVKLCQKCFNYAEEDLCTICQDHSRNEEVLCVVEAPKDVLLFESAGGFHGHYHVLHGSLAPLDGVGPDQLKMKELRERVEKGQIKEVILATSPRTEGEATALYTQKILQAFDVKLSRIAYGLPVGGDLEYVDVATLHRSLEGRREMGTT